MLMIHIIMTIIQLITHKNYENNKTFLLLLLLISYNIIIIIILTLTNTKQ